MRETRRKLRIAVIALVIVVGFGQLSGEAASAGHSIPRDLSIKYSAKGKRFKGKLKSQVAVCLSGIVALHRVEPGPNPIVGSVQAAPDGSWAIAARAGSSRWYADTEGFQASAGYCPPVRSKAIKP